MTHNLATWLLTGRFTAAAPGATEFLGDALDSLQKGAAGTQEPSTIVLFFGVLWKLMLVVILIVVCVWLLKKFLKGGMLPMTAEGAVRVLSASHLSARHSIYLLEVGDKILVVGAGADSLSLLAEITSPVEKTALRDQLKESQGKFSSYLASWAARMSGGETGQQLREGSDFLKRSLQRLYRRRRGSGEGGAP